MDCDSVTLPSAERFFEGARAVLECIARTQVESIRRVGELMASCIRAGGVIHVFGSGHSRAFGMELYHRAGGLAAVNMITLEDARRRRGESLAAVREEELERETRVVEELLAIHHLAPVDVMLIASHSGRNPAVVEMALQVKERGLPLVAVTSLQHSRQVTSRHPSGRRLFELADLVIDNCAPFGDALLAIPDGRRVCAVSSLCGAFIAQALTAEAVRRLLEAGVEPPILISANVDGSAEHNRRLMQRYRRGPV